MSAASGTSAPRATAYGLPLSRLSSCASSCACSRIRSPMRQMIRPRSDGVMWPQGPSSNAVLAARTARSMSSESPSAMLASGWPVAGLGVSNDLPEAASTHCPLINSLRGVAVNSSTVRSTVTVMNGHLLAARRERLPRCSCSPSAARGHQSVTGARSVGSHNLTTTPWVKQGSASGRSPRDHEPALAGSVRDGEDDVRRLDDDGHLAALDQPEVADRLHGDRGDQAPAAGVERDVGDRLSGVDAGDHGRDLVASAQLHFWVPL